MDHEKRPSQIFAEIGRRLTFSEVLSGSAGAQNGRQS